MSGVEKAIRFMKANLEKPVRLADVAKAAGLRERTLYNQMKHTYSDSPMGYLKWMRMERARKEFINGTLARVGDVARRFQLLHAGRFSLQYRASFGESPSRARRRGILVRYGRP